MSSVMDGLPLPQQQRTLETRRKLLDATIDCLVHRGHVGTTTTEVAKRAKVSQGALYKHFPTKAQLLGATAEHLFAQLIVMFRAGFAEVAEEAIVDPSERLKAVLALLWGVFRTEGLAAAVELFTAARTDEALASALRPALEAHMSNIVSEAELLFPEMAGHPALPALVSGVICTMQGASLVAPLHDGSLERAFVERATLAECQRIVECMQ